MGIVPTKARPDKGKLKQAKKPLKAAKKAAKHAAKGKKPKLTSACATALENAVDRALGTLP